MTTIKKTDDYDMRITDLKTGFFLRLNAVEQAFNTKNVNPTTQNTIAYETKVGEMNLLQDKFFLFKNELTKASNKLITTINDSDVKINELINENSILRKKIKNIKGSGYSSVGLLDDNNISRNIVLIGNILLFIIICIIIRFYLRNRSVPLNNNSNTLPSNPIDKNAPTKGLDVKDKNNDVKDKNNDVKDKNNVVKDKNNDVKDKNNDVKDKNNDVKVDNGIKLGPVNGLNGKDIDKDMDVKVANGGNAKKKFKK